MVTGCCARHACMHFAVKALAAAAPGLHWSGTAMLYERTFWLCYGYDAAAAPARREEMCLRFLRLLASPSSL